MNSNKTISILGAGWLGFHLAQSLIADGYLVKGSTTTPSKLDHLKGAGIDPYLFDLSENVEPSSFFDSAVLIINIPPGRRDPDVQTNYPTRIKQALDLAKNGSIQNVLLVSSTGIFASAEAIAPDWEFPIYTDQVTNAVGNSPEALIEAENLLDKFFNTNGTVIRFGGLVGGERLAGRFLAGKKDVANGQAPVNMIHRDDCIGIVKTIIKQSAWGKKYNATTDGHPSRSEFYIAQAEKYNFEKPTFLKEQQASGKIVSNQELKTDLGYIFIHPDPMDF